jgi:hypothetical protein
LAINHPHHLLFPEQFQLTPASGNVLNLFKQAWGEIENRTFFGNKICHDTEYFKDTEIAMNSLMLTPVKGVKGQSDEIKQKDKAANDLF